MLTDHSHNHPLPKLADPVEDRAMEIRKARGVLREEHEMLTLAVQAIRGGLEDPAKGELLPRRAEICIDHVERAMANLETLYRRLYDYI